MAASEELRAQFIEITDALALERIQRSVRMVIDGKRSPDTDHTVDLYGNHTIKRGAYTSRRGSN